MVTTGSTVAFRPRLGHLGKHRAAIASWGDVVSVIRPGSGVVVGRLGRKYNPGFDSRPESRQALVAHLAGP